MIDTIIAYFTTGFFFILGAGCALVSLFEHEGRDGGWILTGIALSVIFLFCSYAVANLAAL